MVGFKFARVKSAPDPLTGGCIRTLFFRRNNTSGLVTACPEACRLFLNGASAGLPDFQAFQAAGGVNFYNGRPATSRFENIRPGSPECPESLEVKGHKGVLYSI